MPSRVEKKQGTKVVDKSVDNVDDKVIDKSIEDAIGKDPLSLLENSNNKNGVKTDELVSKDKTVIDSYKKFYTTIPGKIFLFMFLITQGWFLLSMKKYSTDGFPTPEPEKPGMRARASHILVKEKEFCERLKKEVGNDETKFATAAREFSTCPTGKRAGGSLGSFAQGRMVQEVDDLIFSPSTEYNKTYGCIESKFGQHLVYVKKRWDSEREEEEKVKFKEDFNKKVEEQKLKKQSLKAIRVKKELEEKKLLEEEEEGEGDEQLEL